MRRWLACALLVLPAVSDAQPATVSTWDRFFATPEDEVAKLVQARDLDSTRSLEKIVLEERRLIGRHFGFFVPVSLGFAGGGAVTHPHFGIALDAIQLQRMRDSLQESSLRQVVRFVLAHEWGHMLQFRQIPEGALGDSTTRKVLECEADMFAGSALATIASQQGMDAVEFKQMTDALAGLAFNAGLPVWDFPWMHPSPSQRTLCAMTGGVAGVHLLMVRRYAATHDSTILRDINRMRIMNRSLFGPGDDVLQWFRREASAIVSGVPTVADVNLMGGDVATEVRAIVQAVHFGADSIRAQKGRLGITGARACVVDETSVAVVVRCTWDGHATAAIANALYTELKGLLRPAMYEWQWHEMQEDVSPILRSQTFRRTDGVASVILAYQSEGRRIVATFASTR